LLYEALYHQKFTLELLFRATRDGFKSKAFHEKVANPPSNLANGAVYLLSPAARARIASLGPVFEFSTQVIPAFMGKIYCWQNTVYHRDIGNPQAYLAAQTEFRSIAEKFKLITV
jgi:mannose-1-phosphate guanylyltransferase